MASKRKGLSIDFYGTDGLLKKIESMGKNVEEAVIQSLSAGMKKPYEDMKSFAEQHKQTGDMLSSLEITEPVAKDGMITAKVGFVIKKGGLPSLFLNYGTPRISPTFFINKAIENNVDEIKRLQLEALKEILRS